MFGLARHRLQSGIPRQPVMPRMGLYPGPWRGVVIRVIAGDETDEQTRTSPAQVICDVFLAGGGYVRAVVAQRGSSVGNVSRWVPTPAKTNMVTGAPIKLVNDKLDPPPSDYEDLDGELVVVDWLERNRHRPVIVGSLEHPRGVRRSITSYTPPTVEDGQAQGVRQHSEAGERFLAHQGTTARVDHAGNVRLDLRRAGVGNDDRTYEANGETAGLVDVALREGAELVIRGPTGAPLYRLRVVDGQALLDIGSGPTERILLAGPTVDHLTGWEDAINALGARVSALWASVMVAAQTADDSHAPAPLNIAPIEFDPIDGPTLRLPYAWVARVTAAAIAGTLKAAAARINPGALE